MKNKFFFVRQRPIDQILGGLYEIPSSEWTEKKLAKIKTYLKILLIVIISFLINLKHEFFILYFFQSDDFKINNSTEIDLKESG